jgi:uncharacterized protein (DUF362 family)/ferredoxin
VILNGFFGIIGLVPYRIYTGYKKEACGLARVVIKDCHSYDVGLLKERINTGMELLGGWDRFVSAGMTVLLKVNLIGPKAPDTAAITHPEFVRAVTQILKERGCIVWIGDSSGGAIAGKAPTAESFTVSGLEKMAAQEGAVIKNFDREGVMEIVPSSGFMDKMYLAKPMFDADLVINLPKLKTHSAAAYTGAVKNLFGCIPGLRKAEYHRRAPNPKDLGMVIADIHRAVKVGLNIMDGITAMQGEGPTAGQVYHAGKILMSDDPLALDVIAAAMLGMDIDEIPMLISARGAQVGEGRLERIESVGDYSNPPLLPGFRLSKVYKRLGRGSYSVLVRIIDILKTRPRIKTRRCKGCNVCVDSCPVAAIDRKTKAIDYSRCIECMCCHELCRYQAVELKRDFPMAGLITSLYRGKHK